MNTSTWRPTDESVLIELFASLVLEPPDESRYEITWNQVVKLIGGELNDIATIHR